jgi:hypothetical protein
VLRVLRHSRGLALFALLVMVGSVPVSVAALLDDGVDDACQPSLVLHDHNAHRISASRASATPDSEHCVVCHWLQSVQTVATAIGAAPPPADCHPHRLPFLATLPPRSRPPRTSAVVEVVRIRSHR